MTRLSDEEILNKVMTAEPVLVMSKFLNYSDLQDAKTIKSYRLAESIYIPQIEKLQEQLAVEINSADKRYHDMMEWKEKWLASNHSLGLKDAQIDELKEGIAQIGLSLTARNAELEQLTAKHERLVKEITPFFKRMGFPRYDENETNDYICNSGDFDKAMCAYKLALTEEGNV